MAYTWQRSELLSWQALLQATDLANNCMNTEWFFQNVG